ncbi:Sulfate transport system permease protein CysT [compost metagenome]|jgi:sulfate transport system permease protein|uniref:sulfate ABC transporter permease subunit CysT n=1 Tax=Agrobacterium tumefaciens complex TaxID=1183400 RepID=UPI0004CF6E4D|nr:sulfate ABC transporter permease subunit CysT [Agrobacterium tumefaciens]TGE79264.1 sulfate ABC transporter permease subunit CysT [Rhizobium sp. SEMIA 439]CUX45371.1 sulfate/thiosulfate transport protein (ABC superfamily, membrane) [Agrobacterium tumefaciens str. CFBP 5621]
MNWGRGLKRNVLPGLKLSLGVTLTYVAIIVLLPLSALVFKAASLGPAEYWSIISSPRAVASYRVTVLCALAATLFNVIFGVALAWVLTRYRFPGWRIVDAIVDLPFALPTAVAGIALTTLLAGNGWFGSVLSQFGIKVAYTPLGIMVAMAFTSLPFIVRTVQPVLEDLDPALEEAAQSLGGSDLEIFRKIILPLLTPALLAGLSLSFARSLGEFGAIIFIAGNQPFSTEITALLIFIRLEEYDYQAAAAIASVLLITAFVMLAVTNYLQARALRYTVRG